MEKNPVTAAIGTTAAINATGAAGTPGAISIRGLDFAFAQEKPVFKNLNLELDQGPVVILGPSGCGKTTLLRLMAGLLKPDSGTISTAAASMVFQEPRLLPWKTALENTSLPLAGGRIPLTEKLGKKEAEEKAMHFLALVSLQDKAASLPRELSGGERQRVNVARAFACPAQILLMDEPFQSLDIPLRLKLMDLSLSLLENYPRLAVMVSHDPREAVYTGKRILVLGEPPKGVIYDELISLNQEERRYGSAVQGEMERKLITCLSG